jgi:hypothetical protein
MPTYRDTPHPLEAEVYSNFSFTCNPDSGTIEWREQTPTDLPGSVYITYNNEGICRITGRWFEDGTVKYTSDHPGHNFVPVWQTPTGEVSRVISLVDISQKREDDQSGYKSEAYRALISESFDPGTGKPVNFASYKSMAIPRTSTSSAVDGTRDDQEGEVI